MKLMLINILNNFILEGIYILLSLHNIAHKVSTEKMKEPILLSKISLYITSFILFVFNRKEAILYFFNLYKIS